MKHSKNTTYHSMTIGGLFCLIVFMLSLGFFGLSGSISCAWAGSNQNNATQSNTVSVSSEGERAVVEDTPYAADEFSRANKGTNRTVDKVYRGYNYIQPHENMTVLIDVGSFVMIYVPQSQTEALDLSLDNEQDCQVIKDLLYALDNNAAGGNAKIDPDTPWYFTQEEIHTQNDVVFSFNQPVDDRFYTFVIGNDGTDLSENTSSDEIYLNHASFAQLTSSETTTITEAATGLGALAEFFQSLDFSPLWVTLKTTLTAIVSYWALLLPGGHFAYQIVGKM